MTNFTDEQIAIIDNFRSGASGAVNAVAGSGKTTTAVAAAQFAKPGTLAVAFGKKNAFHVKAVNSGMPCSPVDATSGIVTDRWLARIAIGFTSRPEKKNAP